MNSIDQTDNEFMSANADKVRKQQTRKSRWWAAAVSESCHDLHRILNMNPFSMTVNGMSVQRREF